MELFIITVLLFVAVAYVSFTVGYWYRGVRILQEMSRQLAAIADKNAQTIKKLNSGDVAQMTQGLDEAAGLLNLTMLKHEEVDGRHFFYTKDTDTFVAQGNTLDEAAAQYALNNKTIGCVADPTGVTESYFIIDGRITSQLVK
jgi:hypothetical protein